MGSHLASSHARPLDFGRVRRRAYTILCAVTLGLLGAALVVVPVQADHSPNHHEDILPSRSCPSPRTITTHSYATGSIVHTQFYGPGGSLRKTKTFPNGGWGHRYSNHGLASVHSGEVDVVGARIASESYHTCIL